MIEWRAVGEFPDYEISNTGLLRRAADQAVMAPGVDGRGYRRFTFSKPGKKVYRNLHRLVALAFLPPPIAPATLVCHNNGDRTDNRLSNLRYDTDKGNRLDAVRHGTAANSRPHLTPDQRRALYGAALTMSSRALAASFGVSQDHARWVRRKVAA